MRHLWSVGSRLALQGSPVNHSGQSMTGSLVMEGLSLSATSASVRHSSTPAVSDGTLCMERGMFPDGRLSEQRNYGTQWLLRTTRLLPVDRQFDSQAQG